MLVGTLWKVRDNHRKVHVYHNHDRERKYYENFDIEDPAYVMVLDVYRVINYDGQPKIHSVRVLTPRGTGWISLNTWQFQRVL